MSDWHQKCIQLASDGKLDELKIFEKLFPEHYLNECNAEDSIIPKELIRMFGNKCLYDISTIAFLMAIINDHFHVFEYLFVNMYGKVENIQELKILDPLLFLAGVKEQQGKLDLSERLLKLCNVDRNRFIFYLHGKLYAGYIPENSDDFCDVDRIK